MKTIFEFAKREIYLSISLIILASLSVLYPRQIGNYPYFIDWRTIFALTGLLIITTGLKQSQYFDYIADKTLKRLKHERSLAIALIIFSVILSTFLTNDIALFIVVPLTLSMQNQIKNNISKLIIFEAIAVNVGSALTPIGNPQNLFLWHHWNISFIRFIINMLPLLAILLPILIIFAIIAFPYKTINLSNSPAQKENAIPRNTNLFILSLILLIAYIIVLQLKYPIIILPIIFLTYLILYRQVIRKTDWLLLLLFIIIFIDFHLISIIPLITKTIKHINHNSPENTFILSTLISQAISNVPAAVLISKFDNHWLDITYGVNVGGNGLVIASLANIIAMRMAKNTKIWIKFHKYSILYLIITATLTYMLLTY